MYLTEICVDGHVPPRAGLSSSSALVCAAALATLVAYEVNFFLVLSLPPFICFPLSTCGAAFWFGGFTDRPGFTSKQPWAIHNVTTTEYKLCWALSSQKILSLVK